MAKDQTPAIPTKRKIIVRCPFLSTDWPEGDTCSLSSTQSALNSQCLGGFPALQQVLPNREISLQASFAADLS